MNLQKMLRLCNMAREKRELNSVKCSSLHITICTENSGLWEFATLARVVLRFYIDRTLAIINPFEGREKKRACVCTLHVCVVCMWERKSERVLTIHWSIRLRVRRVRCPRWRPYRRGVHLHPPFAWQRRVTRVTRRTGTKKKKRARIAGVQNYEKIAC